MPHPVPRWCERFDTFHHAFMRLQEALEIARPLTPLEQEGALRRFGYTLELAWKTLKDYLESENVVLDQITPRAVIRRAFEAGIIRQGEAWQNALDARNRMSHTYNFEVFERVIADLRTTYLGAFDELHEFLQTRRIDALPRP